MKYVFDHGVPTTGTIRENSRGFPANMKNGNRWSKASNVDRGSMRWEKGPTHASITMVRQESSFYVDNY